MERKISNWGGSIVAFILVIVVNYLSNALPLNGFTQKDLSDKYTSLFTPAGFTFSIWGVIYLSLATFLIYQALPAQRNTAVLSGVGKFFIATCFLNIAWLFAWHYEFVALSLVIMLCLLATLVVIYLGMKIDITEASWKEHLFLYLPFSLYTAWITVATVANLSILQNSMGWDNYLISETNWTLLKLAVVGVISAIVILRRNDFVYGLVIAWAAFGIMSKQVDTPVVAGAAMMLVALTIMLATYEAIAKIFRG